MMVHVNRSACRSGPGMRLLFVCSGLTRTKESQQPETQRSVYRLLLFWHVSMRKFFLIGNGWQTAFDIWMNTPKWVHVTPEPSHKPQIAFLLAGVCGFRNQDIRRTLGPQSLPMGMRSYSGGRRSMLW